MLLFVTLFPFSLVYGLVSSILSLEVNKKDLPLPISFSNSESQSECPLKIGNYYYTMNKYNKYKNNVLREFRITSSLSLGHCIVHL